MTELSRRDMTLANWRDWPAIRWSFQNVSEFVPVAPVTWGVEEASPSPGPAGLREAQVSRPDGSVVSAVRYLEESYADTFVAMRDGEVIAEWNADNGSSVRPHIIFSITKSVTGMLAGIAAGEGLLDVDAPISRYVKVKPGSAYAEASVRNLLDMSVSLDFEEDYLDKDGAFDRYRRAMLWNPPRDGAQENMLDVLSVLPKADRAHGEMFYYASPDTDMMGLVLEAATGRRLPEYLAERLWKPMGAKGPAYVSVDRAGSARAAGGFCVTARDLARFGQLVLDGGVAAGGARVIPADWIDDMRNNGDQRAWLAGSFKSDFPEGNYRSFWYNAGDGRGSFCGIGIHAQWLWCDPTSRLVLVKLSSRPQPSSDDAAARLEITALSQIARAL